jgi:hypothetical protein
MKPIVVPKSYLQFGCHNRLQPKKEELFEYAISILSEVIDYSGSEQFRADLLLMQK